MAATAALLRSLRRRDVASSSLSAFQSVRRLPHHHLDTFRLYPAVLCLDFDCLFWLVVIREISDNWS
jgi:hypothetical protein